ncbi:MAG: ComEA family DNA-binding protein [Bacteroidota bacterium]
MYFNKAVILGILIVFSTIHITKAQTPSSELEKLIEELIWQADIDEQEQERAIEAIYQLAAHPLDINKANEEDLSELFFLNGFQLFALSEYKEEFGEILSLYELVFIPGFDSTTVHRMMPFVRTSAPERSTYKGNNIRQQGAFTYARTLEQAAGFRSDSLGKSVYLGTPDAWQLRYQLEMGNHSQLYLTGDHDVGEKFIFSEQQYGFDFTSFSLTTIKVPYINQFVVGDFKLNAGQGLTLWSGFGSFKSLTTTSSRFHGKTLRPYHSSGENQYLRGVAFSKQIGNWTITPFYSRTHRNATIQEVDSTTSYISNFYTASLHNTLTTAAKRKQAHETLTGILLQKQWDYLHIGGAFYHQQFSLPYYDTNTQFKGRRNNIGSLFYQYMNGKIMLYGETALQAPGNVATVNGVHWHPSVDLHLNVSMRHLPPSYFNLYANPLTESTGANNEWGILTKITYQMPRYFSLQLYWDLFRVPTTSYSSYKPYNGHELALQLSKTPADYQVKVRFSMSNKTYNKSLEGLTTPERHWEERITYKGQLQLRQQVSQAFHVTANLSTAFADANNKWEEGWLANLTIRQDLSEGLHFTLSYAQFYTTDYLARIYAYEHDVRYAFNIPAFSGKGSRAYLVLNFDKLKHLQTTLKVGRSFYPEEQTLRSGPAELSTNHKTDVRLQVRWKI